VTIGTGSTFTDAGTYTQAQAFLSNSETLVNGTLTAAAVTLTGGRLRGDGTIDAPVTVTGGTLEPGDPPGPIMILSLLEGPGATTQIDLLSNLQFGEIIITGSGNNNVVLDGRL